MCWLFFCLGGNLAPKYDSRKVNSATVWQMFVKFHHAWRFASHRKSWWHLASFGMAGMNDTFRITWICCLSWLFFSTMVYHHFEPPFARIFFSFRIEASQIKVPFPFGTSPFFTSKWFNNSIEKEQNLTLPPKSDQNIPENRSTFCPQKEFGTSSRHPIFLG